MLARASDRKGYAAGSFDDLFPGASDWLGIELARICFGDETREIISDHLVVAASEHFLRGRIHRTNNALFIYRDHSIENVFDDRSNARLDAFEFGQLPSH